MMRKFLSRYWKSQKGLAAVEFAFVLPMMLTMLLGLVELSQAHVAARRCRQHGLHRRRLDRAGKHRSPATDMTNVFNALAAMLYPFDTGTGAPSPSPA